VMLVPVHKRSVTFVPVSSVSGNFEIFVSLVTVRIPFGPVIYYQL